VPHQSVQLSPGVDQNETPALNEAGISSTQLVRFVYDRNGKGLIQKLGGWTKYFGSPMSAVIRALWAWADSNNVLYVAAGTQNISTYAQLSVISNNQQTIITPTSATDNVTPSASTTANSPNVVIVDSTITSVTSYDAVFIETHIAVGGLVLFGMYPTYLNSANPTTSYIIVAQDIFGNAQNATSTSTTTTVASFATTSGQNLITVTLANHGYTPGATYPILVSTTVGGVTLYGNFIVVSVLSANTFTINAPQQATSSTTGSINGGNARFVYSFGVGAVPAGSGYGVGGYGSGGYGTGSAITPSLGTAIPAKDWTLDNWGQILIACPRSDTLFQPVYQWDPTSGASTATVIPQSPTVNDGIFVAMPQRQIVAWGSTFTGIQDNLLIRWCDVNNFNVWIATVTNQAGSYRLSRGSHIVGALQGPQQGFVWTDTDLWTMQYVGLPYVYSFSIVGPGCGLIAKKAAAAVAGEVYWMSASSFYVTSDQGVAPLPCPVWDVIFQNLDQSNLDKIRIAVNSRFNEVAWYYPTTTSNGEVAAYVKYNHLLQTWDYGLLGRSAWVDQSVIGAPIGADPTTNYIYQHETSPDADGMPMQTSFTTGYWQLDEGDQKQFIDQVWPDMKWGLYNGSQNATVNITFNYLDYAGGTPQTDGPYAVTKSTTFITPRIRGRLVSMTLSSNDAGSFWRIGNIRYRIQPDGKF
jgi:hypothetical protein